MANENLVAMKNALDAVPPHPMPRKKIQLPETPQQDEEGLAAQEACREEWSKQFDHPI